MAPREFFAAPSDRPEGKGFPAAEERAGTLVQHILHTAADASRFEALSARG